MAEIHEIIETTVSATTHLRRLTVEISHDFRAFRVYEFREPNWFCLMNRSSLAETSLFRNRCFYTAEDALLSPTSSCHEGHHVVDDQVSIHQVLFYGRPLVRRDGAAAILVYAMLGACLHLAPLNRLPHTRLEGERFTA